jgi:serpin B
MKLKVTLMALSLSLSLSAISRPGNADWDAIKALRNKISTSDASAETRLVGKAIADFGLEQHARLALKNRDGNVVTSPFSVVNALMLAANGAKGETEAQLLAALKISGDLKAANHGLVGLIKALQPAIDQKRFSTVNAFFADKTYAQTVELNYFHSLMSIGAQVGFLDFGSPDALSTVNKFVEDHTQGKIKHLLDQLPPHASIVNAGYFKDNWALPFDTRYTTTQEFQGAGTKQQVKLMIHPEMTVLFHYDKGFELATLVYRDAEFAMDLIVPTLNNGEDAEVALERVEKELSGESYRQWTTQTREAEAIVELPRFHAETQLDLVPDLAPQMPLVLGAKADFSRMSPEGFEIPVLEHAVSLDVNEAGTEGAFATGSGLRSLPPMIRADHSFIAVIRHVATGTPILVATIRKPESK